MAKVLERPELLAPAGDEESLRAAVAAGADAVYFGLRGGFNARARADNFAASDLPRIFDFLHQEGVQGFVTFNTLVFDRELPVAEQALADIARAGADAIIVQDLGVARLAREVCPELPLHASTQMTISSAEAAEIARSLGVTRVVLPWLMVPSTRMISGVLTLGRPHSAALISVPVCAVTTAPPAPPVADLPNPTGAPPPPPPPPLRVAVAAFELNCVPEARNLIQNQ